MWLFPNVFFKKVGAFKKCLLVSCENLGVAASESFVGIGIALF